jgi:hypothetical protein
MHSGLVLLAGLMLGQAPADTAPGTRVDLAGATLFIPRDFHPAAGQVDVIFHLHGAPSAVEPALDRAKWSAVLIEFNRKGLSRVYTEPMTDATLFPRLLDSALETLKLKGLVERPKLGRVVVSSFSAGFGGVRELLKNPDSFNRIDTLVMADSIYAGYQGDPARKVVDPALMDGFRRFALEAAEGRKTFVLTHSAQVPEGYASTTETADYLVRAVGAKPSTSKAEWDRDWTPTRSLARGSFLVFGFDGGQPDDHLAHLRRIDRVWRAVP